MKSLICAISLLTAGFLPATALSQTIISFSDVERLNYSESAATWAFATGTLAAGDASDNNASFETGFTIDLASFQTAISSAQSITLTLSYSTLGGALPSFSVYGFEGAAGSANIANAQGFHNSGIAGTLVATTPIANLAPAPSTISFDVTNLIKGYSANSVASFLITSPISTDNNENSTGDIIAFYTNTTLAAQNGGFYLTVTPVPEPSAALLLGAIGGVVVLRRRRM